MKAPAIPVSWGEVFDKIAILTIKSQRLHAAGARANVARELSLLHAVANRAPREGLQPLLWALSAVNTRLWRIEDQIREADAAGDFGVRFVALARAVYHENDERGRIKAALNQVLQSGVVEEKQYSAYGSPS